MRIEDVDPLFALGHQHLDCQVSAERFAVEAYVWLPVVGFDVDADPDLFGEVVGVGGR